MGEQAVARLGQRPLASIEQMAAQERPGQAQTGAQLRGIRRRPVEQECGQREQAIDVPDRRRSRLTARPELGET